MPNLDSLSEVLGVRSHKTTAAHASLRALGEDGWWTQSRLHEEKFPGVVDDWCRACLNLSGTQRAGTFAHRCSFCPSTRTTRENFKDQEILEEARSVVHGAQPLFRNGIPASSGELPRPVPLIQRWCGGRRPADDDATFTGRAYTDGAMRGGRFHYLRRAGWAAVHVDHVGKILFGIYGTCTDLFPTALRAELWAIERILSMALPPPGRLCR